MNIKDVYKYLDAKYLSIRICNADVLSISIYNAFIQYN